MATGNSILVLTLDEGWYERLAQRLHEIGAQPTCARGARDAHQALRSSQTPVSMVILHGDSDWLFTTRALTQFSREEIQVPCLVVDSSRNEAVRLRFLQLGALDCVDSSELIPKLSSYLLSRSPAANEGADAVLKKLSVAEQGQGGTATASATPSPLEPQQDLPAAPSAVSAQTPPGSLMYMKLGVGEISDAL